MQIKWNENLDPKELREDAADLRQRAKYADSRQAASNDYALAAEYDKKASELEAAEKSKLLTENKTMKISKISLKNILGITSLEFSAGKFNEISGKNGTGKTSILSSILSALKTGHDATLLKAGEKNGEAVIVLSDGMQISKRINETGSTTTVTGSDGKKIPRPAETLKQLTEMMSVNPIDFLRATKRERVSVLLEAMPIQLDYDFLRELTKDILTELPRADYPILELEQIKVSIYDARTGLNRAIQEKHATIAQLSETLPDEAETKPEMDTEGILNQISAFEATKDAELQRIERKLDTMRTESESTIHDLRKQIEHEQARFQEIVGKAAQQKNKTLDIYYANTTSLRADLATIEASQKQVAKHEQTRETISAMHEQAVVLEETAKAHSSALKELDEYKSDLLAELPIPGLTVIDGEIYRDGVQFDRLNTEQQVNIAVELAKIRAGELGIICVDGLELLDSEKYTEFQAQTLESGMQLFVTRVSDDPLSISVGE